MSNFLSMNVICCIFLGVALVMCIVTGYSDNLACTIAGSLGGVITGYKLASTKYNNYNNEK